MLLIYCWNVLGPFFTLNSIIKYLKSPHLVQKAIYIYIYIFFIDIDLVKGSNNIKFYKVLCFY